MRAARRLLTVPAVAELLQVFAGGSVAIARAEARVAAARIGSSAELADRFERLVEVIASDLLARAGGGELAIRAVTRAGTPGLEVEVSDRTMQSAIASVWIERAASWRGLADELDFEVRHYEGSIARARVFSGPVSFRSEAAILGRPISGEKINGDDAMIVRGDATIIVGIADGLGHGIDARRAASQALAVIERARDAQSILEIMRGAEAALLATCGAVAAVARVDYALKSIEHASVGNLRTHIYGANASMRLAAVPGTLGSRLIPIARIRPETVPLDDGAVLVFFTDGLPSRTQLADEPELRKAHPIVIADIMMSKFGRTSDDALVLVLS